jgi:hypothetical protein
MGKSRRDSAQGRCDICRNTERLSVAERVGRTDDATSFGPGTTFCS